MTIEKQTIRGVVSQRAEKWIRISAIAAMFIVALSSAVLSFDGLQKLALASKVPTELAFLFPIAVDVTILMGSLAVLLYELFGIRAVFGWFTVLFGTLLSVTGNVISVADAGIIAQVLHGIIPILLCISLESLLRILRFNIKRTVKEPLDIEIKALKEAPVVENKPVDILTKVTQASITSSLVQKPARKPSPAVTETKPAPEMVAETPEEVSAPAKQEDQAEVSMKTVAPAQAQTVSPAQDEKPKPVVRAKGTQNIDEAAIEEYRSLIASLPEDYSKAKKLAEVMKLNPGIATNEVKAVFGDPPEKRVDGVMKRARDLLTAEAA